METTIAQSRSNQIADLLPQIADERGFLIDIVVIVFILAILVMIVVEIFKFILKPLFQRHTLRQWERELLYRLERDYSVLSLQVSKLKDEDYFEPKQPKHMSDDHIVRLHRAVYHLPRRLFMQQVENEVQRLLSEPSREPDRVKILTTGAEPYAVIEFVGGKRLEVENNRSSEEDEFRTRIHDRMTIAAEGNIDILQLTLSTRWLLYIRITSVCIGIYGAQTIHFLEQGAFEPARAALLAGIGLVAGVTASLIHDLLERLTGGKQDRY